MNLVFRNVLESQALDAKGPPSVLGWDASTRFINEAIQKVVLQGKSPKEELSFATSEMDRVLRNK